MYNKVVDIVIVMLFIANFAIGILYYCDPSFFEKLDDDTIMIIALSMVGSWAIIGGLAFSAEMSK